MSPRRSARERLTSLVAAAAVVTMATALVAAGESSAEASTPVPSQPTGMSVVDISHNGFTVTLPAVKNAEVYRVYTATKKSDIYESAIEKSGARHFFGVAATPRIAVTGLAYATTPYFYRVEVSNGPHNVWSPVSAVGASVAPDVPNAVSASAGPAGTPVISWANGAATGYKIGQSTTPDFSSDVTTYVTHDPAVSFTPWKVQPGTRYYFRVRALNGTTTSPFSPTTSLVAGAQQQSLRVLTYNVRNAHLPHDEAPWSKRLPKVVGLIKSAAPQVFGVEEAGVYLRPNFRQVDSIVARMPGYEVANTNQTQSGSMVYCAGSYIVYKRSAMRPIATGGQWAIGQSRIAAYTAFRTVSGARFLFVDTHLVSGASKNAARADETTSMIDDAQAYARHLGISSIVWVGDMNSNYWRYADMPGQTMQNAGMTDARLSAQKLVNSQYSSINNYQRVAIKNQNSSDHVFVTQGVGVQGWGEILHVHHGRFVGIIPSDHNPVWSDLTIPVSVN